MQRDDISQEVLALEKKFWDCIKEKDSATAVSMSDDPCVVVGAQGIGEVDKTTLARMLEGDASQLNDYAFDDIHVRHITDDVVVVAYKVKEGLVVEGKDVNLQAFDSSVWVRREGQWVCAVHSESIAGDPYGRH